MPETETIEDVTDDDLDRWRTASDAWKAMDQHWSLPLPSNEFDPVETLRQRYRRSASTDEQWFAPAIDDSIVSIIAASTAVTETTSRTADTFSHPETLEAYSAALHSVLERVNPWLSPAIFDRVKRRLNTLLDSDEWEVGDRLPRITSFKSMLNFLIAHARVNVPYVALLSSGNFELSWRHDDGQLVTIEFRDNGWVYWLVFAAFSQSQQPRKRKSGLCPVSDITGEIKSAIWLTLVFSG